MTREEILGSNALSSNRLTSNRLTSNRLTSNRLTSNRLTSNALTSNRLTSNALTSNALRPDGFTEGEVARELLGYIYSCAMPIDASLALVIDGIDYGTLHGAVGLAPEWGQPDGHCDMQCQRWITACLLARTNYWGVPIKISLRGAKSALAASGDEQTRYPVREGTYFGNLFASDGEPRLYACAGPGSNLPQLTGRFCSGAQGPCSIQVALDCANPKRRPLARPLDPALALPTRVACQRRDPNNGYLLDCWTGGVSLYGDDPMGEYYAQAITVSLQEPVAICGDGVCTGSETAGTCGSDCSSGWARSSAGLFTYTFGLAPMAGGDFYTVVLADDTTDLGGGSIRTLPGEQSLILGRFDAEGRHIWSRQLAYGSLFAFFRTGDPVGRNHAIADAQGNVYVATEVLSDVWVGDQKLPWDFPAQGWRFTFVAKVSPSGELLWVKLIDGELDSLMRRADGTPMMLVRVFVHGSNPDEVRYSRQLVGLSADGGFETPIELDAFGQEYKHLDAFAVGPDGAVYLGWQEARAGTELFRVHPESGARDSFEVPERVHVAGVAFAPGGDVITCGFSLFESGHLMRYTEDGRLLWDKEFARFSEESLGMSVSVNASGDIAVLGEFSAPIDLENDLLEPVGGRGFRTPSIFAAKYSGSGEKRWVKRLGGGGYNELNAAQLLDDGSVLAAGAFSQSGVFDGWILENPSGGGTTLTFNSFLVSIPDRARASDP